jgi:hypothetical protein
VIICGDALAELRKMPDESVNCCVTSLPYWGLRDYGTAKWEGGDPDCDHSPEKRGGRFATPVSGKQASNAGSGTASQRDCPCGAVASFCQCRIGKKRESGIHQYLENKKLRRHVEYERRHEPDQGEA